MTFALMFAFGAGILAKGGITLDPIAKPLAAVLAFFYSLVPNYGIAIVLLTIAMMLVLTPLTIKQTRSMLVMQKLQPQMKRLQELHKNDRQALNEAVMQLYKEHNASPLGGCLPMILPLPVFIALLRVLEGLSRTVHGIPIPKYLTAHTQMSIDIVRAHGQLDAFGMNLAKSASTVGGTFGHKLPYFVLLLLMVGTQYYQQHQLTSRNPQAQSQPGQAAMMKFVPLFFGLISIRFPAGVVIYWTVSNMIRIGQQWAMYRYDPKVKSLAAQDIREIEAKTREIEAREHKPRGRPRMRDLLSNAAEAAADKRQNAKRPSPKPGDKPAGAAKARPGAQDPRTARSPGKGNPPKPATGKVDPQKPASGKKPASGRVDPQKTAPGKGAPGKSKAVPGKAVPTKAAPGNGVAAKGIAGGKAATPATTAAAKAGSASGGAAKQPVRAKQPPRPKPVVEKEIKPTAPTAQPVVTKPASAAAQPPVPEDGDGAAGDAPSTSKPTTNGGTGNGGNARGRTGAGGARSVSSRHRRVRRGR